MEESNFSKHAQGDSALANESEPTVSSGGLRGTTILGKVMVFMFFPTFVGFIGLYIGYLETSRKDSKRELSFEQDFALPFALALAMCVVIGFQTGGFTNSKPKPLVAWPKVKKRRKIIHRHVVKGKERNTDDARKVSGGIKEE